MNEHLTRNTTLTLTPRRPALLAGFDNALEVLVRIGAPAMPPDAKRERPPYAIALVIDRSGSMAGRPLEEAKRCADYVVGKLRADDPVALVAFDNRVSLLHPPQPRGDGRALAAAIAGIVEGGNTALHGGWREGADRLAEVALATGLRRVVLLSDGCANAGLTDAAEIAAQCKALAEQGVTTSTYGLGNHFNEDLMVAMAAAGQGNHYYGDTAEDLMEPFQEEFELLENLCLKGLTLKVGVPDGAKVEVLNAYPGDAAAGWKLPDLAWEAEAWALLRLRLPAALVGAEGTTLPCLEVSVAGTDLDGKAVSLRPDGLALPVLNATAAGMVAEDETVLRRLAELDAAGILQKTREAARADDWVRVDALLAEAERRFAQDPWLSGVVESIRRLAAGRERERLMKDSLYSASYLASRLASVDESAVLAEGGKAAYLRRKMSRSKGEFGDGGTS